MDASYYQRIRLWAGITSIGTNLAIIWGCAAFAWVMPWEMPAVAEAILLVGLALGITLANLPFEILVGHTVESALGREDRPLRCWLVEWGRERLPTAVALAMSLLFFWVVDGAGFSAGVVLAAVGVLVVLLVYVDMVAGNEDAAAQAGLAGELERFGAGRVKIRWFDGDAAAPLNGFTLAWRPGTVFLSRQSRDVLSRRELAAMVVREWKALCEGRTAMGFLIALLWCLSGLALAIYVPAPNPLAAAAAGAAVVSTWAFLSLFVWPTLNRFWMREGDRQLLALLGPDETRLLLQKIQQANATDIALPPAKAAVFHPIPPINDRLARLS